VPRMRIAATFFTLRAARVFDDETGCGEISALEVGIDAPGGPGARGMPAS